MFLAILASAIVSLQQLDGDKTTLVVAKSVFNDNIAPRIGADEPRDYDALLGIGFLRLRRVAGSGGGAL